jgi:hypothetical protein
MGGGLSSLPITQSNTLTVSNSLVFRRVIIKFNLYLSTLMSQSLTLELSEQVFVAIQRQAQVIGISPAQLAATLLERQFPQAFQLFLDNAEKNSARVRFEHHFGTLTLGDSTDLDNESIDADLVREYTSTYEGE